MSDIIINAENSITLLTKNKYCKDNVQVLFSGIKYYAGIGVKYPDGAVVTCSQSGKVLTANNTSGEWLFVVPGPGEWVVEAVDGGNVVSSIVNIPNNAEGTYYSVELFFVRSIIRNGILQSGYDIVLRDATRVNNDGFITFRSAAGSRGNGLILIKYGTDYIDMTGYDTLYFEISASSPRAGLEDVITLSTLRSDIYGGLTDIRLGVNNPITKRTVPINITNTNSAYVRMFISDIETTVDLNVYNLYFG